MSDNFNKDISRTKQMLKTLVKNIGLCHKKKI